MNTKTLILSSVCVLFFGFIAFRPRYAVWLASFGKPSVASARVAKFFRIMAGIVLMVAAGNIVSELIR